MAEKLSSTEGKRYEQQLLDCWELNAAPWSKAISEGSIESRIAVTNDAIVQVLEQLPGEHVLDIGCGEGWLCRVLAQQGKTTIGIDATNALIERARRLSNQVFLNLGYHQLRQRLRSQSFDVAVCNFSLLGKQSTEQVFHAAQTLLAPSGHFVLQTIHPSSVNTKLDAQEEGTWIPGSWDGFSDDFSNPAAWFFRSLDGWLTLFAQHDIVVSDIIEPTFTNTGRPASLIIVGRRQPD